uniref:Cyclopropane-fatty-acyl-phospholipid syntahse (Cyclopropane-fatty-acyl-phospholipid_synthase) n=1 Tax=Ganoderma boninense TaxID=34458 RepID=A0A5K1K2G9_9APHY|nr:Cyclopropane-fatty-acyl-phospholipid syntahse (Cyclopropane-fatty-acyl-phospholipid_synthase) [Ganoderma boninense]
MQFSLVTAALALAALTDMVAGESHIIQFNNRCGFGTPTLIQGSTVLSTGANFTSSGPLIAAIAYLQTGSCGFNGEGCTLIETTLMNPVGPPGLGSGADINLIPPHTFSVALGFAYFDGCDGVGAYCNDPACPAAAHSANDSFLQVQCQEDNVNLAITFCEEP